MKLKKIALILFVVSLTVCNGFINAFAMNTGFSTNKMSAEEQQVFLSNIKLSQMSDEPQKNAIVCFDVSNTGFIAIGSASLDNKYISVYDSSGEYLYGYVFNCNQSFGVQWDGTNIIIYFVRSDVAASFDSNGTNIELRIIEDTTENNSYWNHYVFSKEKTFDGNRYTIKNNMSLLNVFASSYSQLIKTDSNGNETIIYDVTKTQMPKTVLAIIAVLLFIVLVINVIIRQGFKAKGQ